MGSPAPASGLMSPPESVTFSPKTAAPPVNDDGNEPAPAPRLGEYRKPTYNYPILARELGTRPGLAIFRRFAALNAKNLLYLQAEIAELEVQLAEQEAFDQEKPERREYQWSAWELMNADPGEDRQWQLVLEIRKKLQEYNSLLLQHAELHKLATPNAYDLTYLRDWLHRQRYGSRFLKPPEDAWDPDYKELEVDLIALSRRDKEGDVFSRWFSSSLWPFIHRNILHPPDDRTVASVVRDAGGRVRSGSVSLWHQTQGAVAWLRRRRWRWRRGRTEDVEQRIKALARAGTIVAKANDDPRRGGAVVYEYPDVRLNRVVEIISILVSSLLPTASIVALNYIPAQPAIDRLVFILAFSGFFTLCLALFTEARRIEIFAAAVALASVQVVFIGTSGSGNDNATKYPTDSSTP